MPVKERERHQKVEFSEPKYRAPALEKGLDILELLARSERPLLPSQIASELDKSLSEIFRMVQVLERRGYISEEPEGSGYVLTDRLFSLGLTRAPIRTLSDVALPLMHDLAEQIEQSVHLVVRSGDEIVVIARVEAPGKLGFSVRVGYRRSILQSRSGQVLFGFLDEQTQEDLLKILTSQFTEEEVAAFQADVSKIRHHKFAMAPSEFVQGVTDISAPIMGQHGIAAALTVPYLDQKGLRHPKKEAARILCDYAANMSARLETGGDA